ncbi:MAG: hypothetical protein AAF414_07455 [Pseudomonadota bacterium]
MKRTLVAGLFALVLGLSLTSCENRDGGFYVEGTGGVSVGN